MKTLILQIDDDALASIRSRVASYRLVGQASPLAEVCSLIIKAIDVGEEKLFIGPAPEKESEK